MLQAAKAAVVAENSTEEARKMILSKTLHLNQKNKMKLTAKKANSVPKPSMVKSAKTIHQVSLILLRGQQTPNVTELS